MAFGFFNYEKPGPGIEKDAPQKNGFFVFFETWFRNIWKLIPISLVYSLMCGLLLPYGMASVGITNVTRNISQDKHSFGISDFFETIKKNLAQSIVAGIINIVLTGLLMFAIYFYYMGEGFGPVIGVGMSLAALLIFSMMKYYIWLIIITFKMPLRKIYKNSFYFVFINFKKNILIGIISLLLYAVNALVIYWALSIGNSLILAILSILAICLFPGFKQLLVQFCVFPSVKKVMIDPYYAEHPNDDIELRKSLGLEVDEPETEEDDVVFNDRQLIQNNDE